MPNPRIFVKNLVQTTLVRSGHFVRTAHPALLIAIFLAFSATLLYAAPPASKYAPGETLDPTCAPGDVNCSVEIGSSLWNENGVDIYYNAGNVGFGVAFPNTSIDMAGAFSVRASVEPALSLPGQGRIYFDSTSNTFKVSENGGPYYDLMDVDGDSWPAFQLGDDDTLWTLHANGEDIFYNDGFVGVNTTEPEYQFESTSATVAARFRGETPDSPDGWDLSAFTNDGEYIVEPTGGDNRCDTDGGAFSADGTKLFLAGSCYLSINVFNDSDSDKKVAYAGPSSPDSPLSVHEYHLSTPWDVNTAVDSGNSYDPWDDTGMHPRDVQFTPDGMRMFVINFNIANPATGGEIHEYALTNPWDLSGGVTYVKEHVFSSNVDSVKSFRFNNDGTKLFLSGWYQDGVTEGDIWEYPLTTPYDIGTIVEADPVVIDFYMGDDYFPTATFEFDTTGTILFMMYATDDPDVFQIRAISYQDPWDISFDNLTAGPDSVTEYEFGAFDGDYSTLLFKPDGLRFYTTLADHQNDEDTFVGGIEQYSLTGTTSGGDVIVDGRLSVGTISPTSKLTVIGDSDLVGNVNVSGNVTLLNGANEVNIGTQSGGLIVSEDPIGVTLQGEGSRMVFLSNISAFRAGYVDDDEWDPGNLGEYSTAFGDTTIAFGRGSFAAGRDTEAAGDYSVAFGRLTFANGDQSNAFGYQTNALGNYSTTFGHNTSAQGLRSFASGWLSIAEGENSTAFGYWAHASGNTSTAFGYNTEASGVTSTVFGSNSVASGETSIAFGESTLASGDYSTAFGNLTEASGWGALAGGVDSVASGDLSVAFGDATTAQAYASTVFGRLNVVSGDSLNWVETDQLFVIGNGTDSGNRSNAFTVLKNGNIGINNATPGYALDVTGDINFTGNIYQNGVLFTGAGGGNVDTSLWALNAEGNAIFNTGGLVGINTLDPEYQFEVTSGDAVAARFRSSVTPWDLASRTNYVFEEMATGTNCFIAGGKFNADGTKIYTVERCGNGAEIVEYNLSTAWDIASLTESGNAYDLDSEMNNSAYDVVFSISGSKMFVLDTGAGAAEIHQYVLATPWDVTTATYQKSHNFVTGSPDMLGAYNIHFSKDGSTLYLAAMIEDAGVAAGTGGQIPGLGHVIEYELTAPWDVGTVTEVADENFSSFAFPQLSMAQMFSLSSDGERLFVGSANLNLGTGAYDLEITSYSLDVPWSIANQNFEYSEIIESGVPPQSPTGFTNFNFSPDGLKAYTVQASSSSDPSSEAGVAEYSLTGGSSGGGGVIIDGDLAVGNDNPSYKLHVTTSVSGSVAGFTNSDGTCSINPTTSSLECASDESLKTDVLDLSATYESGSSLSKLSQLRPVTYKWVTQTSDERRFGLIAQEVRDVFPEFVTEGPDGKLAVSYGSFTPVMIDAIKELNSKVDLAMLKVNGVNTEKVGGSLLDIIKNALVDAVLNVRELVAGTVRTKTLCLEDGSGETCIDRNKLNEILGETDDDSDEGGSIGSGGNANTGDVGNDDTQNTGQNAGGEGSNDGNTTGDDSTAPGSGGDGSGDIINDDTQNNDTASGGGDQKDPNAGTENVTTDEDGADDSSTGDEAL